VISRRHWPLLAYADDLALAFTGQDWANDENAMNRNLSTLHTYYHQKRLQLNKEKTVYASYHLNTRDVGRRLNISVDGKTIEFEPNPTYLGVKIELTHLQATSYICEAKSFVTLHAVKPAGRHRVGCLREHAQDQQPSSCIPRY